MKNFSLFLVVIVTLSTIFSRADAQESVINIVPKPKSVSITKGEFRFNLKTKLFATDEQGRKSAGYLNDYLLQNYGFKLEFVSNNKRPASNVIVFSPLSTAVSRMPNESYGLTITPKSVQIVGSETGQFYALQSFFQLLPTNFKGETKLQCVDIIDEPRFKYRGMHLDVGRHFFPVSFVKRYIDLMSQYKFNFFHWHLTEDQGWRIEIKKYPKLTEIGSLRKETVKGKNLQPYVGDGQPHGGFYTQEQIKDVVSYAKSRFITIIPEIELPGHSSAALAAYPNLGCKENATYQTATTWGIFKEVYCPKEETFQFLEDVLSEVIELFPDSPYIHIGGDEVLKDEWKISPIVKDLMQREGLKDEHAVQSYFIGRIEKFINAKGKKIIGWDEILEGGLAPNATVMSWRGEKGGIDAAKAKHDVIMTPANYVYFDYGQGDPKYEPINIGNNLSLQDVYSYNPIPKELNADDAKYILGAQGNVWTEYLQKPEDVEYMAFPRMLALSEVVWTPAEAKNFNEFSGRLPYQFQRLDKQKVNYRIPPPIGLQNAILTESSKIRIELKSPVKDGKIYFTTDRSEPSELSERYKSPFEIEIRPLEKIIVNTIVVTATGRKSMIYSATILRRDILQPVDLPDKKAGVKYSLFKGNFKSVREVDQISPPNESGETKSIQLTQFAMKTENFKQPFGVIYEGYISAPTDEIYEFQLECDDGAILILGENEEAVVNLDGIHGKQTDTGLIPLKQGLHKIRLKYFQTGGDAILNVRWGIKGQGLRRIYGDGLVH